MKLNMKWIYLTNEFYTCIDDEDFEEVSKYIWVFHGKGYAYRRSRTFGTIFLHNLLMSYDKNENKEVDHINRAQWDNRKSNLRIVERWQNNMNRGIPDNPPFPTDEEKIEAKKQRESVRVIVVKQALLQKVKNTPPRKKIGPYYYGKIIDDLGNIYESASLAAKAVGALRTCGRGNGTSITACCKGRRKSCYGRKWSYYKDQFS